MSDSTSTGKVPHLVHNAQLTTTIGTATVSHLQLALSLLMQGRDLSGIEQRIASGSLSDQAEIAIVGLSSLLTTLYQVAQDTQQITYKDLDISGLGV